MCERSEANVDRYKSDGMTRNLLKHAFTEFDYIERVCKSVQTRDVNFPDRDCRIPGPVWLVGMLTGPENSEMGPKI